MSSRFTAEEPITPEETAALLRLQASDEAEDLTRRLDDRTDVQAVASAAAITPAQSEALLAEVRAAWKGDGVDEERRRHAAWTLALGFVFAVALAWNLFPRPVRTFEPPPRPAPKFDWPESFRAKESLVPAASVRLPKGYRVDVDAAAAAFGIDGTAPVPGDPAARRRAVAQGVADVVAQLDRMQFYDPRSMDDPLTGQRWVLSQNGQRVRVHLTEPDGSRKTFFLPGYGFSGGPPPFVEEVEREMGP
jgi:hypothetical protein